MGRLADVQEFLEKSRSAASFDDLRHMLGGVTRQIGFDHFALMHHIDMRLWPERRIVALSDYPDAWKQMYIEEQFQGSDPVVIASQRMAIGFAWDDLATIVPMKAAHRARLEVGRKAGIANGFTVPANIPGETCGSCTFATGPGKALPQANFAMAQLVGSFAFQAARDIILRSRGSGAFANEAKLSTRQLECVLWLGRGKTAWETGQILGISEGTVNEHLDDARRKYGVSRRVELIVRAAFSGEIALSDMVGSTPQ